MGEWKRREARLESTTPKHGLMCFGFCLICSSLLFYFFSFARGFCSLDVLLLLLCFMSIDEWVQPIYIPCIRFRFFLRSHPVISEVGCATGVGPRSSRATKKVSRFEVWMENVLSKTNSNSGSIIARSFNSFFFLSLSPCLSDDLNTIHSFFFFSRAEMKEEPLTRDVIQS